MKNHALTVIFLSLTLYISAQNNVITNLPYSISENVNTTGSKHLPVLTTDGKTLYFCGSSRTDNIGLEDIYVSYFKDGEWTKAEILKDLSTTYSNDAPLSVSADGNSMILFRDGKIYSSNRTKDGWDNPVLFDELNFMSWNCDACYTADGNAILFTAGTWGYGIVSDIYVIVKQKDGSWSEPINLGETVNAGDFNRSRFFTS